MILFVQWKMIFNIFNNSNISFFSFFSVTVTNNQMHSMGPLGITTGHDSLNAWQMAAVELVLTFLVVFTTFATIDPNRKSFGSDSLSIGIAYLVASLTGVSKVYQNWLTDWPIGTDWFHSFYRFVVFVWSNWINSLFSLKIYLI